jgi:hypothetical protein
MGIAVLIGTALPGRPSSEPAPAGFGQHSFRGTLDPAEERSPAPGIVARAGTPRVAPGNPSFSVRRLREPAMASGADGSID